MATRYDPLIESLRAAARPEQPVPATATAYVETVRRNAYRMADSLKFEVPPYESFLGRAETMLAEGYTLYALPPVDAGVEEEAE